MREYEFLLGFYWLWESNVRGVHHVYCYCMLNVLYTVEVIDLIFNTVGEEGKYQLEQKHKCTLEILIFKQLNSDQKNAKETGVLQSLIYNAFEYNVYLRAYNNDRPG